MDEQEKERLRRLWRQVTDILCSASKQVPPEVSLGDFQEYIEHNELELAWNALFDSAHGHEVTSGFWLQLAEAANLMKLPDHAADALREAEKKRP